MPKETVIKEPAKLAAHTYSTSTADMDINLTLKGQEPTQEFLEEPIGARLIVEPYDVTGIEVVPSGIIGSTDVVYRKKGSNIVLTEDQVKQVKMSMAANSQPAKVIVTGPLTIPVQAGDIVRIFLNQAEAKIDTEEKAYLVYHERCIITKIK